MIQQQVAVILELAPDGTSSAFSFDIGTALGFHVPDLFSGSSSERWPFVLLNSAALPDSVTVNSVLQNGTAISGVTASISHRTVTLVFPSAPSTSGDVQVTMSLNFNG